MPLETAYRVDAETKRFFDDNGYVKLPAVLDPDTVRQYEPEITSKVIELNTQHLPLAERDTYGKAFLQVMNLWQQSDMARELVFSRRLARIAADLLGVNGVRIYHDQALYKEPGGGITPWHADQYYWPLATDRTVTVWIPLQETPIEMGPLAFAAGSHRFDVGRDMQISDESERELSKLLLQQDFPHHETAFALGEVSYHQGWTFHHASANTSPHPRRVLTIIYMDADMRVAEPVNDNQRNDLRDWLPGAQVGGLAATHLNPILSS